jgi:hypothetical protein
MGWGSPVEWKLADMDADSEWAGAVARPGRAMSPGTAVEACGSGMRWAGFSARDIGGAGYQREKQGGETALRFTAAAWRSRRGLFCGAGD